MNLPDKYIKAGVVLFVAVCLAVFYIAWNEPTIPDDSALIPMKILRYIDTIQEKDKRIQLLDSVKKFVDSQLLKKPHNPSLLFAQGLYYTFTDNYAEAISIHSRNYQNMDRHNNSLAFDNTKEELARNYALQGIKLLESDNKDTLAAINSFRKSFDYMPYFGLTARKFGLLMLDMNQIDSAKMILTESLKLYPGDGILYGILGFAYFKEKNYTESEKCFMQAHNIDPTDADANKFLKILSDRSK